MERTPARSRDSRLAGWWAVPKLKDQKPLERFVVHTLRRSLLGMHGYAIPCWRYRMVYGILHDFNLTAHVKEEASLQTRGLQVVSPSLVSAPQSVDPLHEIL